MVDQRKTKRCCCVYAALSHTIITFYSPDDGRGTSANSPGGDKIVLFAPVCASTRLFSCSLMLSDRAQYHLTLISHTNSTPTFL